MPRILLVWELGTNLNHLANLAWVARAAMNMGCEIGIALRELDGAHRFFPGIRAQYFQAPFCQAPEPATPERPACYAHLLYKSGFHDARDLAVRLSAWRAIFESFRPDVLVYDHAPTAMVAARGFPVIGVGVGSGALLPTPANPLGVFPSDTEGLSSQQTIAADEAQIVRVINAALQGFDLPPLGALEELFTNLAGRWLFSIPALDIFAPREAEYLGAATPIAGLPPKWPPGTGPRLFAYLSPFHGFRILTKQLSQLPARVLAHVRNLRPEAAARLSGPQLRFVDELVDFEKVAQECDGFLSHGGHRSVTRMLCEGVPQLVIPLYREQEFTAQLLCRIGGGTTIPANCNDFQAALHRLLEDRELVITARTAGSRHRHMDAEWTLARMKLLLGNIQ